MIIETVVSTINCEKVPNFAPMGITCSAQTVVIRPFVSSKTYQNLKCTGEAVVNITDNVLIIAKTVIGDKDLRYRPDSLTSCHLLEDACRFISCVVEKSEEQNERAVFSCRILGRSRQRDFSGFNRAKHAVIEASILATRLHLCSRELIDRKFDEYRLLVQKTGSAQEEEALALIENYIKRKSLQGEAGYTFERA